MHLPIVVHWNIALQIFHGYTYSKKLPLSGSNFYYNGGVTPLFEIEIDAKANIIDFSNQNNVLNASNALLSTNLIYNTAPINSAPL
jgi:hypothetical protein